MGWVIVVGICIILLIITITLSRRKKAVKAEPQNAATPIAHEPVTSGSSPKVDQEQETSEVSQGKGNRQLRTPRPTTLEPHTEQKKSYVRYDWQEVFEDSIVSIFPEELSPASPYLHRANQLEREGADQLLVDQVLLKAREVDAKATQFYLARWAIVKKRQKERGMR